MSRFFIDRPIFASVLSIAIALAGVVAMFSLPLAMYPPITPPTVQVTCQYPGASAEVVAQAVAAPIEQQINGVEGMMYMSSQSTNDGQYSLTVTFKNGVDMNMAQVLVQSRINLALPQLPDVIRKIGVTTRKRSPDILMIINLVSPDRRYDQLHLSNYALMHVREELARVQGVGDVFLFGERDYSMRIWVDPDKLASRNLTAGDVTAAVREQSQAVALGQLGQAPAPQGQDQQFPLSTLARLVEPSDFGNVVLKATADGRIVRIKDVAHVELGAKTVDVNNRINGQPSIGLAIFQLPDANAFDTGALVRAKIDELAQDFPEGLSYVIRYDTTPFVRESIAEVFKTLRDAVILVAAVVLLFLQNWRSAVIPLVAVPVAIVGTFAVMEVFGFSLNNLTLFGLVLAIGIVVDDAIVVVEAVERQIELGLSPREATIKAMEQVSGPVIAVGLVLSAVFVPCAFISGIIGQFFRQFALTIAASTIISAFNSLTLSPALTALLLRPHGQGRGDVVPRLSFLFAGAWAGFAFLAPWAAAWAAAQSAAWPWLGADWLTAALPWVCGSAGTAAGWLLSGPVNWAASRAFGLFNLAFERLTGFYAGAVGISLRLCVPVLLIYTGMLGLTWVGLAGVPAEHVPEKLKDIKLGSFDITTGIPRGFIPSQDMGYFLVNVQLPAAASDERCRKVMTQATEVAAAVPGVTDVFAVSGQSFVLQAAGSNFGAMFIILAPFDERQTPDLYGDAIAARLRKDFAAKIHDGTFAVFGPPPIRGIGNAGGFRMMLEDRGDLGLQSLQEQMEAVIRQGNKNPSLTGLFGLFRANVPEWFADVDRGECLSMRVPVGDVFDALQVYLGSLYVNDFNRFGRTWQVKVQADARFRNEARAVGRLKVRNGRGDMVPMAAVSKLREETGPLLVMRYNMYPAAFVNGGAKPGVSSGQSIALMQKVADAQLPAGMAYEWTEMAYLELINGNTAMMIFALSVVTVFLVLAAQYESWSLPLAVILVVPMCLLSAIVGVAVAKLDVNVFTQIGFVVLVGLASKNAILIVEFAKTQVEEGKTPREATLAACRLRLRPIIMTSLAFILGVVPLMITHGAGAEMRRTLGVAVFSGMLGVTIFGIFLTPVFFFVIEKAAETRIFASRAMRLAGSISLMFATAGVRQLARLAGAGVTALRGRGQAAPPNRPPPDKDAP